MKNFLSLLFICCFVAASGQPPAPAANPKHEQIGKALNDYFSLERENIHVHINKNIFTTNESIWFKGYVFHRKKNVPFFTTINVYAALLDPTGKVVETQLVYGNIGSFSGSFKLNGTMTSGKYYLQFYTNWMNNFSEDESAVYEVSVINQAKGAGNVLAKGSSAPVIEINPEGGVLLQGITNTVGINVYGCGHTVLPVTEAELIDNKGQLVKKFPINKLGYGKVDVPANASGYKIAITLDAARHEKMLPAAQLKGLNLEVNNYGIADKTVVKVRTNNHTVNDYKNATLYLLAHQDDKLVVFDISFANGKTEQSLMIPNTEFFEGTNIIRVLDGNLNQLAERIIYMYPKATLKTNLIKAGSDAENVKFTGTTSYPNMNLSVSVLPENTRSLAEDNDIYGDFLISPYIRNKAVGRYYFAALSKGKHYELDLFLLNQKSKYEWSNILHNPPKSTFPFDLGLTVKGTVTLPGDHKYSKVRMFATTAYLEELTDVNDKNEFIFENVLIPDSTYVNFTLLQKGQKPKDLIVVPQLLNANRKFYKMYKPELPCESLSAASSDVDLPDFQTEAIELEGVEIQGKTLKYAKSGGNQRLRAVKVGPTEITYNTIANYLRNHGFIVEDSGSNFMITTKGISSINAAQSVPAIYLDGIQIYDYDQLRVLRMTEIDEIYLDPRALVPSVRNFYGIIKIYRKREALAKSQGVPTTIIKNGYKNIWPFRNVTYASTTDQGFEQFGVVEWAPVIMTDEKGAFNLNIPVMGQKTVKVIIEGFSADGKLISEIKTVNLN